MWLLGPSEYLTCSVVSYGLNTTSMYFTQRLYFEAFQKQACRKRELSEHPLVNLSSTSEYYIAPHQPRLVTLMRFLSLWRMLESEAHLLWVCLTQYVPLLGFRSLSTVSFFRSIPALFHAGSVWGILPFKAFSSWEAVISFDIPCLFDVTAIFQVTLKNPFPADLLTQWMLTLQWRFRRSFTVPWKHFKSLSFE